MEKEEPLVIAMTNGDNESAVKKIVLDPDNGIVVTQDKTRKKRFTKEGNLIEWFVNVKVSKNQSLVRFMSSSSCSCSSSFPFQSSEFGSKVQLISKCSFGVFKSSKKATIFFQDFFPSL